MNIYAIIILSTIIFGYLLDLIADQMNLKALDPIVPDEFKDIYDDEKYSKSQEYTTVKTKFGFVISIFNLVLLLGFWSLGGFNLLDRIVRAWDLNVIFTGLLYIGILVMVKKLLSIPFSIYSIFVIEERFGFNKTTWKTFFFDFIKSILISVVIGGLFLGGILAFFEYIGKLAWLYAWGATVIFTFIMQVVYPTFIMPLFNKFLPLEDGDLRDSIMTYAKSVEFPLQNIFVMDGSKRSTKSNAFFTGFGRQKRIVLFDTLIEKHSVPELVAVLAHEVGHFKKKHVIKGTILSIIQNGFMFFLLSIFLRHKGLFDAFFVENMSIYVGLILFGMLYSPISMILSIFSGMFLRKIEYEADRFALDTFGDKDSMINALKNLAKDNLSNLTPHPFYVFLNYSHPPILKRIKELRGAPHL